MWKRSEMEVAPRYMLLTLLTLLSVDMVDTIQNVLHCLNSSIMLLACMPVYIVREVEWTGVDTPSKGPKDCYDYCGTCSAIDKTFLSCFWQSILNFLLPHIFIARLITDGTVRSKGVKAHWKGFCDYCCHSLPLCVHNVVILNQRHRWLRVSNNRRCCLKQIHQPWQFWQAW